MKFVRDLHNLSASTGGCVATIGNFDGVHLGHQLIIKQLQQTAETNNLPSVLLTFEPHPQEFFSPDNAQARLMRLREKLVCLRNYHIDRVVCLKFNQALAELSAEDFIRNILVDKLAVRHLIVGEDFRFGNKRKGNISTLESSGRKFGFLITCTETCEVDGQRVSSSRVRNALASGNLPQAERLLGRPYSICGRIVHGDKRGRILGYPTININMHRQRSPVSGIFATKIYGLGTSVHNAVTSIGTRPVFNGANVRLEAHVLDFDAEVYGNYVCVELLQRLRPEQNFETIDELKIQIETDINNARKYFSGDNIKNNKLTS
jgi:riboflavin kinase / FMN adenylyltransferase